MRLKIIFLKCLKNIHQIIIKMETIKVENHEFKIHPKYDLYVACKCGNIIFLNKKVIMNSYKGKNGYLQCTVKKHNKLKQKTYYVHRFVYECFHCCLLEKDKVIDHINNIKTDNRLDNLQLITQKENNLKFAKNRDYDFVKNHKNRTFVKATNMNTNEALYFNSLYAVNKNLNINPGLVKMVCKGLNNAKTAFSKKDNPSYISEYIKQKMFINKWSQITLTCSCGKIYKNCTKK